MAGDSKNSNRKTNMTSARPCKVRRQVEGFLHEQQTDQRRTNRNKTNLDRLAARSAELTAIKQNLRHSHQ